MPTQFRAVIELRHCDPVVAHGNFTMLLPTDSVVCSFTRSFRGSTLLVVGNFSAAAAGAAVPEEADWAAADLVLGNDPTPEDADGRLVLRPWEARIYRRPPRTIVG